MARDQNIQKSKPHGPPVCTERRHWRNWCANRPGQWLLETERQELEEILPNLFGYHLLQVGCLSGEDILGCSRVLHRVVVDIDADEVTDVFGLYGRPDALPIDTDSVDVVLLPHTLEFENDPHQVLREVERVLVPEGHVVILGFNPWSIWGLWWNLRLRRGDTFVLTTSGGGGLGDPHTRDPAALSRDVAEGYVSADAARRVYGAVPR